MVNIRSLRIEKIRDTSQTMPPDLADMLRHFGYNVPPSDNNNNQSDSNKKNNNRRELQRSIAGLGSGFLISPSGLVVTNNHVINRASEIKVTLSNDKSYTAKVIGTDDRSDLALLKIDGTKLPYVSLAIRIKWGRRLGYRHRRPRGAGRVSVGGYCLGPRA